MSAATISRWNAIPLDRPAVDEKSSNKHARSDDDEDSEDNTSLVSRSPSPARRGGTPTTYDENDYGEGREVITVHTRIKPTNKGHALLMKMGWKEGEGIGTFGKGRPDPIPFVLKSDSLGLGKLSQDLRVVESTIAQRRDIESERQSKETVEQRQARQSKVAQKVAVQIEVKDAIKQFYCDLCGKQYINVAQYDEHLRSYAHCHKQRLKDQQASQRAASDSSKMKEKERKREEKELRKLAAAAGIKMAAPTTPLTPSGSEPATPAEPVEQPAKRGWKSFAATVTAPSLGPPPTVPAPAGGFKKSGWATIGATAVTPTSDSGSAPPTPFTPSGPPPLTPLSSSGQPPPPRGPASFQSAGFTTLDTSRLGPGEPGPSSMGGVSQSSSGWKRMPEGYSSTSSPGGGSWNRGDSGTAQLPSPATPYAQHCSVPNSWQPPPPRFNHPGGRPPPPPPPSDSHFPPAPPPPPSSAFIPPPPPPSESFPPPPPSPPSHAPYHADPRGSGRDPAWRNGPDSYARERNGRYEDRYDDEYGRSSYGALGGYNGRGDYDGRSHPPSPARGRGYSKYDGDRDEDRRWDEERRRQWR